MTYILLTDLPNLTLPYHLLSYCYGSVIITSNIIQITLASLCVCLGKREIDGQLFSTQSTIVIQEESIRRAEREQKQLSDRANNLERAVAALEAEKRQLQVGQMSHNGA